MPHDISWRVQVLNHPGSSDQDVRDEPACTGAHQHRVGVRNRQDRLPGLTHDEDGGELPYSKSNDSNGTTEKAFDAEAKREFEQLKQRHEQGDLINFRDIISGEKDLHLRYPQNRSLRWRYVLDCTENGVKNEQNWPANIAKRRRKKRRETRRLTPLMGWRWPRAAAGKLIVDRSGDKQTQNESEDAHEESDWKRSQGENIKHNTAYAASPEQSKSDDQQTSEYERLLERYTPQEIALLRNLQHEKDYRKQSTISIGEADQFSPDNCPPRSEHLIRLTGKHPSNTEAELTTLFDGGLITPNELHYVRNHGAVPRILWENHELDVENGKLKLSMDDLKKHFEVINIPVSLACDGNRRKELNMIKKSKGFNWGAGATGCVYWKGPMLRDVLLAAGIEEERYTGGSRERWVNFQGADEPSEGKYETVIPPSYAMVATNDILLTYEMNDVPLLRAMCEVIGQDLDHGS
ncbi:hypothetical protein LTR27_011942 [Elasticomyces elasticus]|nr:hypothetical protein LTR27_011942 [Elasticomyces elasticus]